MLWKCCTQYASKFGKLAVATGLKKVSFNSSPKERWCQRTFQEAHSSITSKVVLKILQARLQQYMNWELPDVQAGFSKGRGTRDQIANIHWTQYKQGNYKKTSTSASLTLLKPLTVWIRANYEIFLKRWEYQTTLPASWETCTWSKK